MWHICGLAHVAGCLCLGIFLAFDHRLGIDWTCWLIASPGCKSRFPSPDLRWDHAHAWVVGRMHDPHFMILGQTRVLLSQGS